MARSSIGLDLGTSAVRAAEVRGTDVPTLVRFGQLALPPGAMSNGEVVDADAVASVLKDLWRRAGFKSKRVHIAVANQNVVVRQVDMPRMSEEDLGSALGYQVQDYIPIPLEDAILDYVPIEEFTGEDGAEMMRVLAIAAQREMIEQCIGVLTRAGLDVEGVDIAPLAAVRALSDNVPPVMAERAAEVVVDVGSGVTNVAVHEHGTPRFVRIVPSGGNDITGALVAELGLTPEEAEVAKTTVEMRAGGAPGAGAEGIVEQRGRAFVDDLRRSIEFYQSQPDAAPIERVLLVGGGARLAGLRERLAEALHLTVEDGNALARVQVGEAELTDEQLEQVGIVGAVAVGLALET
jgi:type IV pilus assembly protein PilM